MTATLATAVAYLILNLWQYAAVALHFRPLRQLLPDPIRKITRTLFWELRPLFIPAAVIYIGLQILRGQADGFDMAVFGLQLFNWWNLKDPKDDDDDRWKRRKEKLAAKVGVLGGRLVVEPLAVTS